jgi:hypothetical protein
MAQDFEKTSLPWSIKLWQQRTGEWFENLTSGWKGPDLPDDAPKPEIAPQTWEGLFWLILIVLGGLLAWKLYPLVARLIAEQSIPRPNFEAEAQVPVLSQTQWLQQARTAKEQGDYAKAARALYFAALARLQERELISTDRSLTNGEYRAQLKKKQSQNQQNQKRDRAYQTLANTHEALHYSQNTPISAQRYDDCDRAYRDIEQETP